MFYFLKLSAVYIYIYTSKGPAGEFSISKLPYFNDGPPLLGKLNLCNGLYLK